MTSVIRKIWTERRTEIWLGALAAIVHGIFFFLTWRIGYGGFMWSSDAVVYWEIAKNVLTHGTFTVNIDWGPMAFRTPLYPLFLAATMALSSGPWLAVTLQNILATASVLLVFRISESVFHSRRAALLAGLLFLLEPERLHLTSQLMSETLFVFLFLLGVLALIRACQSNITIRRMTVVAVWFGLATLDRPVGQLLPIVVTILLLFLAWRCRNWRQTATSLAVFLIIFVVIISPWVIRNGRQFGVYQLSSLGGVNMYYSSGRTFLQSLASTDPQAAVLLNDFSDRVMRDLDFYDDSHEPSWVYTSTRVMEFRYEPYFRQRTADIIGAYPKKFALYYVKRSILFLVESGWARSAGVMLRNTAVPKFLLFPGFFYAGRLLWVVAYLLIAAAVFRRPVDWRQADPLLFFWIVFLLASDVLACMNSDQPRMRVPADALTLMWAGAAIDQLFRRRGPSVQDAHSHDELHEVYHQVPPDYWDVSYRTNFLQRLWHDMDYRLLRRYVADLPPKAAVLDVGCGSGFSTEKVMANRPDIAVTGVDVTDEVITYALKVRPQYRFERAVGETLPFPDAIFDAVLLLDVIEHMVDPVAALRQIKRVLHPGGKLILLVVQEHHPLFRIIWWLWLKLRGQVWHDAHLHIFDSVHLEKLLRASGFTIVVRGTTHLGMSLAVVAQSNT